MSKKKILSESEIRRFQGLAGIPTIGEMHCPSGEREEEEGLEELGMDHDGARHEEEPELPGDEGPEDELEMDVEMEPSDEGGDLDLSPDQKEDLAADIVRAVAQELSQALDLDEPIEVETDGDAGADLDMDMDMGGDDEELDLDLGDEPEEEGDAPGMRYMEEDPKEEMMNRMDEVVEVDPKILMEEIRRAKKISALRENRRIQEARQKRNLQENHLKSIIRSEIQNILENIDDTDASWVYGKTKPKSSRKGYTNQGRLMQGIGFGKKY